VGIGGNDKNHSVSLVLYSYGMKRIGFYAVLFALVVLFVACPLPMNPISPPPAPPSPPTSPPPTAPVLGATATFSNASSTYNGDTSVLEADLAKGGQSALDGRVMPSGQGFLLDLYIANPPYFTHSTVIRRVEILASSTSAIETGRTYVASVKYSQTQFTCGCSYSWVNPSVLIYIESFNEKTYRVVIPSVKLEPDPSFQGPANGTIDMSIASNFEVSSVNPGRIGQGRGYLNNLSGTFNGIITDLNPFVEGSSIHASFTPKNQGFEIKLNFADSVDAPLKRHVSFEVSSPEPFKIKGSYRADVVYSEEQVSGVKKRWKASNVEVHIGWYYKKTYEVDIRQAKLSPEFIPGIPNEAKGTADLDAYTIFDSE
jgi:hypothetical protein